ncbi:MAG: hypothetical protein OXN84_10935 [Albidovulum sp.]|nr:hypothetical protein [Albidovulum sp.]
MNSSTARIEYAGDSTLDQRVDDLIAPLQAEGCTKVSTKTRSGSGLERSLELGGILDFILPDDTPAATRIDFLARSMAILQVVDEKLLEKNGRLTATYLPMDYSTCSMCLPSSRPIRLLNVTTREASRQYGGAPTGIAREMGTPHGPRYKEWGKLRTHDIWSLSP